MTNYSNKYNLNELTKNYEDLPNIKTIKKINYNTRIFLFKQVIEK